jgi:hypothetical protein
MFMVQYFFDLVIIGLMVLAVLVAFGLSFTTLWDSLRKIFKGK